MPQASNEHRELMDKWFGDPINDFGPMELLMSHGFKEIDNGLWTAPTPNHSMSEVENACLMFLINEWDHDYLDKSTPLVY